VSFDGRPGYLHLLSLCQRTKKKQLIKIWFNLIFATKKQFAPGQINY